VDSFEKVSEHFISNIAGRLGYSGVVVWLDGVIIINWLFFLSYFYPSRRVFWQAGVRRMIF